MTNPIELVKQHPMGTAIVAIILIAAFFVFGGLGGGSATADTTTASSDGSDVQAGLQMQALSASLSAQNYQTDAAKTVALATLASQDKATALAAQNQDNQTQAALQLGETSYKSQDLVSTLAAQIQGKQIDAQVSENAAQQSTLQAQIQAIQNINTANNQPKGLFSWLFG